jgi:hypothetical protein
MWGTSGRDPASALFARFSKMHPARPLKYLRLTGPLPVNETVSTPVHVRVYRAGDWWARSTASWTFKASRLCLRC